MKFDTASLLAQLYQQQKQSVLAKPILRKAIELSQHNVYWHCKLLFQLAVCFFFFFTYKSSGLNWILSTANTCHRQGVQCCLGTVGRRRRVHRRLECHISQSAVPAQSRNDLDDRAQGERRPGAAQPSFESDRQFHIERPPQGVSEGLLPGAAGLLLSIAGTHQNGEAQLEATAAQHPNDCGSELASR